MEVRTEPVFVRAGPQRVTAAFIKQTEGPVQDLVSPHEWSLASTAIAGSYGVMSLPHMRDFVIAGPFNPTGVSETPTRRRIFTCRPTTPAEERTCSEEIITRLGSAAFRRPLTPDDREALMRFYAYGVEEDGFETGVRTALEAMLSSPHFVFRLEEAPQGIEPGSTYRVSDIDLASRLSFFLWGSPPDQELLQLAEQGELSSDNVPVSYTHLRAHET